MNMDNAISKLPDWQKGWLAGMIDGEGFISISSTSQTTQLPHARIGISMTCELTIKSIYTLLEPLGATIHTRTRPDVRTIWTCTICNRMGIYDLLTALLPYFLTKAETAHIMLTYVKRRIANVTFGKADEDMVMRGHQLSISGPKSKYKGE